MWPVIPITVYSECMKHVGNTVPAKTNKQTFKETLDSGAISILHGSMLNSLGHCGTFGLGISATA